MRSDELKPSRVIGNVFRHVGVFVGTTAAIGRKITGAGISGLTAARDLFTHTVGRPALVTVNDFGLASEGFTPEPIHSEMTARGDMQGSVVSALESDLTSARRELEKTLNEAEAIQSQLASQLKVLQAEKESLISELDGMRNEAKDRESAVRARVAALESDLVAAQRELEQMCRPRERKNSKVSSDVGTTRTGAQSTLSNLSRGRDTVAVSEEKVESSMKATAARPEEEATTRIEEQPSQVPVAEAEASGPEEVTLEEVGAAVFSSSAESVIFTKAFSDISNPDAAVRIDSVRAIGSIRHKLSVRVLVEQVGRESSARVRQECIKALTNLDAKEGLGMVERALSDRAALVRLAAVWGLYRLAGTESATALARMCSDEDEEVRRRAATCIGWLGREEFAVELLPFLKDGSVSVRRAAVEAMGTLGSRQVVSVLIEHLEYPVESFRKAVLNALKAITGKEMNGAFPKDQKSLGRLISRWRQWWKEVYPG
jgi:hypothetical protein